MIIGISGIAITTPSTGSIGSLWTPANLGANLSLWFDASDSNSITLNGSTVSQWSDKSGNAQHVVQATAGSQPTYTTNALNGKAVLTFGTSSILTNSTAAIDDPFSLFAVGAITGAIGTFNTLFRFNLAATANPIGLFGGGTSGNFATFFGNGSTWNDTNTNTPSIAVTSSSIMSVVNGANVATPYVNDVAQNTKVGTMAAATGFSLGLSQGSFPYPWNGTIAEVVLTNNAVGTTDRQKVSGYLAWKWGLQANLDAGHPYKNAAPTV